MVISFVYSSRGKVSLLLEVLFPTFDTILNIGITHNENSAVLQWNRVNQSPCKLADGYTIFCLSLDFSC